MKIAYLISAHTDPVQLKRLIRSLTNENNQFFIHIDKKQDIFPFMEALKEMNNVYFIKKRVADYWGGYSHLKSQYNTLKYALNNKPDRLVFISGMDYPVWSNKRINDYYNDNDKQMLCAYNISKSIDKDARSKISHCACWDIPIKNDWLFNKTRKYVNRFLKIIPHSMQYRKNGEKWDIFWGSDWWSLTYEAAEYVINTYSSDKKLQRYFRWSFCPSELWIHTILANSNQYKDKMDYTDRFSFNDVTVLQHINYCKNMKVWKEEDYEEIIHSGKMFIRKTTSKESEKLQDKIDSYRK